MADPITLEPLDYYTLRTRMLEADRVEAEARIVVTKTLATRDACLATLATTYGFEPTGITGVSWNDTTHQVQFTRGAPGG